MSVTSLEIDLFNVFTNLTSGQPNVPAGSNTTDLLIKIPQNVIQILGQSSGGALSLDGDLFVPNTTTAAGCRNLAPPEVVNASLNLPATQLQTRVAFVPWTSNATCFYSVLQSAADQQVRAFITYLNDDSEMLPPDPSNVQAWGVPFPPYGYGFGPTGSGNFPIYAIPGRNGRQVMDALSAYVAQYNNATANTTATENSTATTAPTGQNPWIFAHVSIAGSASGLPGLWVIVLCVVGVFLAALLLISLVTRIVQRRRRNDLRRRILTGEADLVALGVKRVTVPEEILNKFPLEKFHNVDESTKESSKADARATVTTKSPTKAPTAFKYAQSSCAICLDDYAEDTLVRILPCAHIFHPECVDAFLKENSSLCPICKRTVLPQGYCPADVTNAMVRRDRAMRAGTDRPLGAIIPAAANALRRRSDRAEQTTQRPAHGWTSLVIPRFVRRERTPETARTDLEMQPTSTEAAATTPPPPSQQQSSATNLSEPVSRPAPEHSNSQDRQEWARRRAVEMVGGTPDGLEEEERREAQRPAWRKIVSKAFPSF